jgi:hypothetical protein
MKTFNPSTYKYTPQLIPRNSLSGESHNVGVHWDQSSHVYRGELIGARRSDSGQLFGTVLARGEGSTPQKAASQTIGDLDRQARQAEFDRIDTKKAKGGAE